ncbi:hypothetical protein B5F77_03745 [Parabacteroides sp. An277]|uniref:hypothetical protein n=1 Tax=Parabacteroides sp. An277 TaxID=1965619 RepID=UPI000B384A18|nr:hypothetical protein [Parabacteroides sp. An277]OUO54312.1 hypothetical protein B5F77_03745 [Parabacteroides sp. An277]
MYLTAAPTNATLNAYTMTLNKTVSQMDGSHTITVYTEDGNKTPDEVIANYADLYYGAKCTVEVPSNIHCTMGHHFMGWLTKSGSNIATITEPTQIDGTVTVEQGSETKQILRYETSENDASGIVKTDYYATWVDNEMSILVKTETDWSTTSAPVVSVTPTEAIGLLDYTFNAGGDSENTELKVQNAVVGFSTVSGKENILTGTPTLAQDYDQPSKTLTDITATVNVKDSSNEGVTVKFDPFTIYKYDMLITSASINSNNQHEYTGLDHNGTEGEPDHLLTVKGKIENDPENKEYVLREGTHYRIISYKYNDSADETSNTTDGVKLVNAGKYSDITIMNRLDNGVKFDPSFSGTTDLVAHADEKKTTLSDDVTIAKHKITVTPTSGQSWTIGTEGNPTINYTPVVGSQVFSGETVTEKVAYTGSLGLSTTQDGPAISGNPTKKGTYYIVQNDLALADDNNSGFDTDNYELAFTSDVTYTVQETLTDNNDITIDVSATDISNLNDWTYDGKEHTLTITVKDDTDELTKDTDYTLSLTGGSSSSSSGQLTAKNAGEYTVTITGKGEYTGSKTTKFTIKKATISAVQANEQTVTLGKVDEEFVSEATSETVTLTGLQNDETPVFNNTESKSSLKLDDSQTYTEVKDYPNAIIIDKLELTDAEDGSFLASNYKFGTDVITNATKGTLKVVAEEDIEIDFPNDDDSDITVDADGNGTMVYNGSTPEDINLTISIKDDDTPLTSGKDYTVKYTNNEGAEISESNILNVGTYTITVTIIKGGDHKDSKAVKTLKVTERPLTVTILEQTIEANGSVNTKISDETVRVDGEVKGETAAFSANSSLACTQSTLTAGTIYEDAITKGSTFELGNGEADNNFKATNYSLPETIAAADLIVKQSITDGGDENDPYEPTDDEDPEIIPDDGNNDGNDWKWNAETHQYELTYDGNEHPVSSLKVKFTKEDGSFEYKTVTISSGNVSYNPNGTPKDANTYTATVTISDNDYLDEGTLILALAILPREMHVDFILPSTIESTAPLAITNSRVKYEAQSGIRGLLTKEQYPDIESGQFIFGKPNAEGLCKVTIQNFILATSTSGFKPSNYQLQIWDAEEGKYVDYNNQGGDITIIDPENPDENNPNNPGGSDSGVVVDPDGDDDNNDHGHGGNTPGGDGKVDYYNMYVDTAATCDGVELSFSKNVVPEGNQVNVYVDKILEGYNADDMKLWFKRSLYGYWEELEEGVQPGEYIIYNVYTDIYVKVTDVKKEDATGIEDVEGAKVYTQDGSLYVYTPSRLPVWIISMTGAVVRNEEQIGLQQYDRLNRGIYIVRVGEQVFKIRL